MFTKTLLAASALVGLSLAQTHSDCNPMVNATGVCPNDAAIAQTFETNFVNGVSSVKGWKQTAGSLNFTNEGAVFTINQKGDAPTIQTEGYLFFGYVEVKVKSASGQGIISSIVLESDDLDEVDWEFLGSVTDNVQMNYFGKGNTTTYDRMIEGPVTGSTKDFHTYALNWTSESLVWIIDDKPVRTLNYADAVGGKNFPQTPCNVRIGIWAGGDSDNEAGVISWAGGKTDYTKGPYSMVVSDVKITNYNPGTEYKWKDQTGSYESIEVVGAGNNAGSPNATVPLTASTPASTAAASKTGLQGLGSQVNVPTGSASLNYTGAASATGGNGGLAASGSTGATAIITGSDGQATPVTTGKDGKPTPCTEEGSSPKSSALATGGVASAVITGSDGQATPVTTGKDGKPTPCTEEGSAPSSAAKATGGVASASGSSPSGYGSAPSFVPISAPGSAPSGSAPSFVPIASPPASGSAPSGVPFNGGSSYGGNSSASGEAPCDCGVATVTVTGTPPASPTTLVSSALAVSSAGVGGGYGSASSSAAANSVPYGSSPSSAGVGGGYGAASSAAAVTQPPKITSTAPYPTGGLKTDTNPAPSVPFPTGGVTGSAPNGTTTGGTPLFTGAASSNKMASLAVAAGLAALVF